MEVRLPQEEGSVLFRLRDAFINAGMPLDSCDFFDVLDDLATLVEETYLEIDAGPTPRTSARKFLRKILESIQL